MAPKIEPIGSPVGLGEGPYWDEETHTLYFIDLFNHSIHSYKPSSNQFHSVNVVKPMEVYSTFVGSKEVINGTEVAAQKVCDYHFCGHGGQGYEEACMLGPRIRKEGGQFECNF